MTNDTMGIKSTNLDSRSSALKMVPISRNYSKKWDGFEFGSSEKIEASNVVLKFHFLISGLYT